MKEVTLKIPDKRYAFFLELMQELGFETINHMDISELQKNEVRERIGNSKDEDFLTLDEARKQLVFRDLK